MNDEKIKVRVISSGQELQVVVFNKSLERIEVVFGEGVNNVRCTLSPTRSGDAYVGSVMGREIIYPRTRDQVRADLEKAASYREFRR